MAVRSVITPSVRGSISSVLGGNAAAPNINFAVSYRFRADSGVTLSSGNASAWQDSVAGLTLTQATSASRPIYSASEIGGKPALRFQGTQFLDAAMTAALAAIPNGDNTMLVVLKELGAATIISGINGAGGQRWGHLTESGQVAATNNSGVVRVLSGIATTGSRIDSRVMIRSGSDLILNVNGTSVTGVGQANNPAFTTANLFSVGRQPAGSAFAQMAVAEIVIVNRALIAAELLNWHQYVTAYYGITIA